MLRAFLCKSADEGDVFRQTAFLSPFHFDSKKGGCSGDNIETAGFQRWPYFVREKTGFPVGFGALSLRA